MGGSIPKVSEYLGVGGCAELVADYPISHLSASIAPSEIGACLVNTRWGRFESHDIECSMVVFSRCSTVPERVSRSRSPEQTLEPSRRQLVGRPAGLQRTTSIQGCSVFHA
jgi:hypothetical protein